MRNIGVIIKKQIKDTLKNKAVLIQFVMFPVLTLIFENAIDIPDMPELFFTKLFSVMYMGMAPLTSVASIISEEKEKNTLRVLMMANVKAVGISCWYRHLCLDDLHGRCRSNGNWLPSSDIPFYLGVMAAGFIISIAIGACIGIFASNQMVATSLCHAGNAGIFILPMLAMFNDKIEKVAGIFYTQQIQSPDEPICLLTG